MGRKMQLNKDKLLTHHIQTRVDNKTYEKLNNIFKNSDCQSIGELARKILSREKITCYYRDTTMDAPIKELSNIREELNAIGVNINQITLKFHIADSPSQMMDQALRVEKEYKKVGDKVDQLLAMVFEMSKKWLQR